MAMPRALPAVLGSVALLATTAILVVHVILASHIVYASPVRTTAILSSVLEGAAMIVLGWLFSTHLIVTLPEQSTRLVGIAFGTSVLVCTLATAASVATMICLSNATVDLADSILGSNQMNFMIGSSVALGLAFACQLIFIVVHFVLSRLPGHRGAMHSLHTEDGDARQRSQPQMTVKAIPYSATTPFANQTRRSTSIESRSPPGSSGGMSSIRSSLSNVVRPMSSKSRLISGKERRRPSSLDSTTYRERNASVTALDGFDTWDTSAVDPHNRQTVLESSGSPIPTRFLETIPASPTTSRSPSPGCPLDLEPPRHRRRSRSYSPAPLRRPQVTTNLAPLPSPSESHIHPLFRSDSPTPPNVTANTVITAAPDAVRVISDRASIRSLSRMRSGSSPAVPSPLSRNGSFEDFYAQRKREEQEAAMEAEESNVDSAGVSPTERKMTPPIPDWILSAGTRTSLSGYQSRKNRIDEPQQSPRLG